MYANCLIRGFKVPAMALMIVAAICIFAYGAILRATGTPDVLEKKVVDHPSCPGFDGWAVTHFFFWGLIGFLYPDKPGQALFFSFLWEGFEQFVGCTNLRISGVRVQAIGLTDKDGRPIDEKDVAEEKRFWYGRWTTDPLFNITGYILGSAVAAKFCC